MRTLEINEFPGKENTKNGWAATVANSSVGDRSQNLTAA